MTIESQLARIAHTASGNTVFAYTWKIFDDEDLTVYLTDTSDVATLQVLDSDYTVTGAGDDAGGTIVFASAPTATDTVTIILDPDRVQTLDLSGGALPLLSLENALDKLLNIIKRVYDVASRALTRSDAADTYDLDSARLINVLDPEDDQDAATQAYVNAQIAAATLDLTTTISAYGATLIDDADAATARTTLGATTTGSQLFTAASGSAAMTGPLGIASTIANVLDAATSYADFRSLMFIPDQIPQPNLLDFGADFQVWQTGTSRTGATAFPNSDDTYFADGWILLSDGNDRVDITNSATAFGYPTGCLGLAEFEVVSNVNKWGILRPIETLTSVPLRSKTISISFWVVSNAALGMRVHLASWGSGTFTGDTITSDIISAWGASTTKPTAIAGVTLVDADSSSLVTTSASWVQKIYTFTVPADAVNVGVFICTDDSSYNAADKVAFSGFMVSTSAVATPFVSKPFGQDLAAAGRWYAKTFPYATAPAQNTGSDAGALYSISNAQETGDARAAAYWTFPTRMLKVPTVLSYNPSAAASTWDEIGGAGTPAASYAGQGETGVYIYSAPDAGTALFAIHATADARL